MSEDLPTPIGDEVKAQFDHLQSDANRDVWTPEDEVKLQEEITRVGFDPSFANPNFPDREVLIDGQKTPIHFVNNFPMILNAVDASKRGEIIPESMPIQATYAALAPERKYMEIFEALEHSWPALYKRTRLIEKNKKQDMMVNDPAAQDLRDYHKSKAYSAAAAIARQIDPNYDLTLLNP